MQASRLLNTLLHEVCSSCVQITFCGGGQGQNMLQMNCCCQLSNVCHDCMFSTCCRWIAAVKCPSCAVKYTCCTNGRQLIPPYSHKKPHSEMFTSNLHGTMHGRHMLHTAQLPLLSHVQDILVDLLQLQGLHDKAAACMVCPVQWPSKEASEIPI